MQWVSLEYFFDAKTQACMLTPNIFSCLGCLTSGMYYTHVVISYAISS